MTTAEKNYFIANLSLLYSQLPLSDRFEAAAEHGFSAVEIQFPYELSISEIGSKLTEYGLRLHLINIPAGDLLQGGKGLSCHPENEQAFREACAQAMEYATALNVRTVNVLAGNLCPEDNRATCLDTYISNIRYAAELFMLEGIQVSFEAINDKDMPDYLYHSFTEMLDIYRKTGHANAGMQYDIYHMARMGEDIISQLGEYGEQIAHIQFADVPGRGAPGSGSLDLPGIFKAIEASSYIGPVAAEYKITGDNDLDYAWLKL
ncbi:hydroxypyruvate isomerase family protein [Oceanospirillum sediminis]|uniref:TIM barrel protein n=1 Tax=Oceanospirillum sediminis TaxID=2760088 RepID=A0A839IQQ7_9GAMM|nr:TIM barrel protein [Oceanospirillum sediminis]MBB1486829.1 TIM barrel protein [Oceanospirillum sediminis]